MRLLAFVLAIIVAFPLIGSNPADSVEVYFRAGHRQFDPSLGDNRMAMDGFIAKVREAAAKGEIDSIIVRAYASPDGTERANILLSRRRCDVIADLIANRASINRDLIHKVPEGIAWNELRSLVELTPDVPSRQKVLEILDNTPLLVFDAQGKIVDGRKKQLMDLNGGRPYRWLYANLFPRVRSAVALSLIKKQEGHAETEEVVIATVTEPDGEVTVIEDESYAIDNQSEQEEVIVSEEQIVANDNSADSYSVISGNRIALKTNLLGYAVLMPNVELEWMFAKKWSAALEYQVAWYSKTTPGKHKVYRLATITPEVRFWPIERSRWHGMYVGVFGGVGLYDLSRGRHGHEGEGFMTGISAGYMFPIGKHLSIDAGLGVGYMRARDKEYYPHDGHYLYQLTKNINYVGPLRLKLSLVWRFYSEKIIRLK